MSATDPFDKPNADEHERKFLENIREHGYFMTSVAPRTGSDDPEEWFTYTTGLFYEYRHPEVIIFGLQPADSFGILDGIAKRVKSGEKFRPGERYLGLFAEREAAFRTVDGTQRDGYLCWSSWFYEASDYAAIECFWPDGEGRYPWDEGVDSEVRKLQPDLSGAANPTSQSDLRASRIGKRWQTRPKA